MPNGLSSAGFKRKRLDEILADKNEAVKGVLGENLNLSPESPDGQINGVYSESDSILWEVAEAAYNAFSPSKATENTLSSLVELNGITRQIAVPSTSELTLSGAEGTVIPLGSLVSTVDKSVTFSTDFEVTIPAATTILVTATATATGPLAAVAGSISVIDTPVTGWASVTNTLDAVIGANEETDAELRARRARSVAGSSSSMLDGITANVLELPNVTYAQGFENNTDSVDSNGQIPHSVLMVVEGATDEEVAQAIFVKVATGINTDGNTSADAIDSQNVAKSISFSRPVDLPIFVRVDIITFDDFPASGVADIKQAIVDYANGILIENRGFGVSEDVIRTELFTPINATDGQSVSLLAINTTGSPTAGDLSNIAIDFDEKSEFTIGNIEVNIL